MWFSGTHWSTGSFSSSRIVLCGHGEAQMPAHRRPRRRRCPKIEMGQVCPGGHSRNDRIPGTPRATASSCRRAGSAPRGWPRPCRNPNAASSWFSSAPRYSSRFSFTPGLLADEDQAVALLCLDLDQPSLGLVDGAERRVAGDAQQLAVEVIAPAVIGAGEARAGIAFVVIGPRPRAMAAGIDVGLVLPSLVRVMIVGVPKSAVLMKSPGLAMSRDRPAT